jgi:SAM-dependent methyltransferase
VSKAELRLSESVERDGDVVDGVLSSGDGRAYAVRNGIPRLVAPLQDAGQKQTQESFAYKWQRESSYSSPAFKAGIAQWVIHRYGFGNDEEMRRFFSGKTRILDAGCGGGLCTSLWMAPGWRDGSRAEYYGVDISEAIDVAKERIGGYEGTHFVQADVMRLPFRDESFDSVFSEGVLHHTASTRDALASLVGALAPGGDALFYVYRKKAPIREFTDDWVRAQISSLAPDAGWEALRPLTALGESLANLHTEIDVPLDIPFLGIKAGRYDIQRFVYWHIAKVFWNEQWTFDENNHVNFDWYHPRYAHRQTEDEIREWCEDLDLTITHFDAQESGFTVRAIKRAGRREV